MEFFIEITTRQSYDFAYAVREATGCRIVRIAWADQAGNLGHHTLNATGDGRLFDVHGWTDETILGRRYGIPRKTPFSPVSIDPGPDDVFSCGEIVEDLERIASIIPHLPDGPFSDGTFPDAAERLMASASTIASERNGTPEGP